MDALQPGTVWVGQHLRFVEGDPTPKRWIVTFTVQERRGDRFKALWHAGQIRMIDGNIKDGRVWWFARDVEAIQEIRA